jgi:hypothetical protein
MKKFWQSILLAAVTVTVSNTNAWAVGSQTRSATKQSTVNQIAQRDSVCLNITFSNSSSVHYGRLVLGSNGRGLMRVSFYDARSGRQEAIDQVMVLQNSRVGLVLVGYNPVIAGTNRRHPTYAADNFIIRKQPNGDYLFFLLDDAGAQSPTEVSGC